MVCGRERVASYRNSLTSVIDTSALHDLAKLYGIAYSQNSIAAIAMLSQLLLNSAMTGHDSDVTSATKVYELQY